MPASAFAAVASFKVILFGKNNIAFRGVIKIFGVKFFFKRIIICHDCKVKQLKHFYTPDALCFPKLKISHLKKLKQLF